jgi:hypothetical protein
VSYPASTLEQGRNGSCAPTRWSLVLPCLTAAPLATSKDSSCEPCPACPPEKSLDTPNTHHLCWKSFRLNAAATAAAAPSHVRWYRALNARRQFPGVRVFNSSAQHQAARLLAAAAVLQDSVDTVRDVRIVTSSNEKSSSCVSDHPFTWLRWSICSWCRSRARSSTALYVDATATGESSYSVFKRSKQNVLRKSAHGARSTHGMVMSSEQVTPHCLCLTGTLILARSVIA